MISSKLFRNTMKLSMCITCLILTLTSCNSAKTQVKGIESVSRDQLEKIKMESVYLFRFKDTTALRVRVLWNRQGRIQGVVTSRHHRGDAFNKTYDEILDQVNNVQKLETGSELLWPAVSMGLILVLLYG